MKKAFIVMFCFVSSSSLYSQQLTPQQLIDSMLASMKRFEAGYVCRSYTDNNGVSHQASTVSEGSFDSLYRRATNRILVSSQDVLSNGRAAAVGLDEGTKKIAINYTWAHSGKNTFLNAGFKAEDASSKFFSLFGKDGWSQGFTLNGGGVTRLPTKSILFYEDTCEALKRKRQHVYRELLTKYNRVARITADSIRTLNDRKTAYERFTINGANNFEDFPRPMNKEEEETLLLWNQLQGISVNPGNEDLKENLYKPEIEAFEVANFKNFGYKLHWLNYGFNFGLRRFSIYDQSLLTLAKIDKSNLVRYGFNLGYNFFQESAGGSILYFGADASISNTNFLEEILPVQVETLRTQLGSSGNEIVGSGETLVVDNLERYKKEYALTTLGVVFNYFPPLENRMLGFELGASTKLKFGNPDDLPARDLFTIRFGPLFVYEKNKIAKSTIAFMCEFRDIEYRGSKTTIKDSFSIGIRLGVPFNY